MNPEVLLVTTPACQLSRLSRRVPASAGLFPGAAGRRFATASCRTPEKFLSSLAAFRDQKAPAGFAPNLLSHVSSACLLVADERDMRRHPGMLRRDALRYGRDHWPAA